MLVGLANGSRSANKSIHAELLLSAFDLFGALFLLVGSNELDAPWIRFKMSNAKLDVAEAVEFGGLADLLAPQAAPLNISNKQSDSVGSSSAMSSKSNRSVSIGGFGVEIGALSLGICPICVALVAASEHCFASSSKSS